MFKYNEKLSFDDNSSHGKILKNIKQGESVLEFGCGNGQLAKVMKEVLGAKVCAVEISEIAMQEAREHLELGIVADAEKLEWVNELGNRKFDVIVCADILEHLRNPEKVLQAALPFLEEDGRVIFSVPNIAHGDIIVKLLDNRFDYTSLGLLDDTHIHFFAKENLGDFCESAGLFLTEIDTPIVPMGATEQKNSSVNKDILAFIQSKDYANAYQFVCVAYKKIYAEQNSFKLIDKTRDCLAGKIYFDTGSGFSEDNIYLVTADADGLFNFEITLPDNIVAIRFDPTEASGYVMSETEIFVDGTKILPDFTVNVEKYGDDFVFINNDPQLLFEIQKSKKLSFKGRCLPIYSSKSGANNLYNFISNFKRHTMNIINEKDKAIEATSEAVKKQAELIYDLSKENDTFKEKVVNLSTEIKEKNELIDNNKATIDSQEKEISSLNREFNDLNQKYDSTNRELEHYKEHYLAAINQREELKVKLAISEEKYNVISNSQAWKITKPLRVILDVIKKIIKKIPPLYLMAKGLKCLKQNGFKYTFRKIKDKFKHNSVAKSNSYTEQDLEKQSETKFARDIKFSILVPLYNTDRKYLTEMIESVMNQSYQNWELCLADGSDSDHSYVETTVNESASKDSRIKYMRLEKNLGISENTNACEKMASGDYIAFLDHDDLLSPGALYENARAINETNADVLYSDEDHLSPSGMHVNPFYKPDFSPDLLKSQMYICHFTVINRELFESIGGFDSKFDGSQDYDLMLRLTEVTDKILHIPLILYTWRECEGSTAANADAKPYAHTAGRNALDAHLKRKYGESAFAADSDYTFVFDARYGGMEKSPLVSIIIPFKDKSELTENCVNSILEKSSYNNYEIILLDNRSEKEETYSWINKVQEKDGRIKVFKADMEFNWSKINNFGISKASGEVYVFLNNDTLIITPDWIERLSENAIRDDIGVVGPLLLYEDDTIQHAGVLVGAGGWADHVFKGMKPIHFGAPYVSPMVSRNVLAVTGACLAVSKKTIEKIGNFDESFVICGSDIELGIRAYENGLYNKYMPTVRLYHLESKSRDSYIPEIDFKRSYECYAPYRENIDPFYNINLDVNSLIPQEKVAPMDKMSFKNFLKRCPITAPICKAIKRAIMPLAEYDIPEVGPIGARKDSCDNGKLRLNLLTPSVDSKHVFGGISTAMKLFEQLRKELNCEARMITLDASVIPESSVAPKDYNIISSDDDSSESLQLVAFNFRHEKTIPVRQNDIFMATGWWTAYTIKDVIKWQSQVYTQKTNPLIYMIQDYEPGFYPWSSRYMMAESTYNMDIPIYAVINSELLREFLDKNGYKFEKSWAFEPVLNDKLATFLPKDGTAINKKKQILIYGRPSTERNAFALLISGLKKWRENYDSASEWKIISAGESHDDIDLGDGVFVKASGKLSLEEYANTMLDTYAGISLMVSPHPSYPPLEMSTFGIKTITNCYANKDLSSFNDNIISISSCSAETIASALVDICENYDGKGQSVANTDYALGGSPFGNCVDELAKEIKFYSNL